MDRLSLLAYVLLVLGLIARHAALITVQGRARFNRRTFRWPEDARAWGGEVAEGGEAEIVERAQAAIRNDAETVPLFLAIAGAWVALGASGRLALATFGGYLLARSAHAWFFVHPRQPARNRAFVLGQLALLGVAIDAAVRAFSLLASS